MIGIVFIGDLYVCPYLKRYTDVLEDKGLSYEVMFWNRCGDTITLPANYKFFNFLSAEEQPLIRKAFDFLKYRKWLKKQIKMGKYDKLILLSTLSGMIIPDILTKYKNNYIFDIRDYSYEKYSIFYFIEKSLIMNSSYTCISSPGFKHFLPEYSYMIMHNVNLKEVDSHYSFQKKPFGSRLNLVWNGTIRYFDHQKRIISQLSNDDRFNVIFHGDGPEIEKYKKYVKEINANNVFFTGRYDNADKKRLLEDADILNNSYWIENVNEVKYALSNRYYDGLIYKIPQLVELGTYKTTLCETNGIGIGLDSENDSFADSLYEWYYSLDGQLFDVNCNKLLDAVTVDNQNVENRIQRFLS